MGEDVRLSEEQFISQPVGALEWVIPTAVAIYIAKPFIDALIKRAADDLAMPSIPESKRQSLISQRSSTSESGRRWCWLHQMDLMMTCRIRFYSRSTRKLPLNNTSSLSSQRPTPKSITTPASIKYSESLQNITPGQTEAMACHGRSHNCPRTHWPRYSSCTMKHQIHGMYAIQFRMQLINCIKDKQLASLRRSGTPYRTIGLRPTIFL